MGIFDFGKRQRLHTQLYGHTSGGELFKVDEYNRRKTISFSIVVTNVILFTIFYFMWNDIPIKIKVFMFLGMVGTIVLGYFNLKNQKKLGEGLYK